MLTGNSKCVVFVSEQFWSLRIGFNLWFDCPGRFQELWVTRRKSLALIPCQNSFLVPSCDLPLKRNVFNWCVTDTCFYTCLRLVHALLQTNFENYLLRTFTNGLTIYFTKFYEMIQKNVLRKRVDAPSGGDALKRNKSKGPRPNRFKKLILQTYLKICFARRGRGWTDFKHDSLHAFTNIF